MSSNIPLDALHNPDAPFNEEEREACKFGADLSICNGDGFYSWMIDIYADELPDLQKDLEEAVEEVLNRYNIEK